MSPFRYILKRGGSEHPIGYSLLLLAGGMFVSMMVAVVISVNASNRAIQQNKDQEAAQQRQARHAACLLIIAQDDAFNEPGSEPVTKAGQKSAAAWRNLRTAFQCDKE